MELGWGGVGLGWTGQRGQLGQGGGHGAKEHFTLQLSGREDRTNSPRGDKIEVH
jgi:hypothetical protein